MRVVLWVVAGLLVLAGLAALWVSNRPGADLGEVFRQRLTALPALPPAAAPVTEADLARLPEPVQRWLRHAGVVGRPPVRAVHVTFDATLYSAPDQPGMRGPAHQVDVLDPPRRLFHMSTHLSTWMGGLPVQVLHDYRGHDATMQVRLAGLLDVADFAGPLLSRTETVTLLNDLCAYAPSALLGPAMRWEALNAQHARVVFTNGPHTVSAELTFDAEGWLVDFRSEDRGDVKANDRVDRMPWTTPLSEFRSAEGGRRVPGRGDAVWHRADGPFVYGRFRVERVTYDEAALR
jgi:hypothetical protein